MLIEILRDTSISGRPAMTGQVVDADEAVAQYFLTAGKARKATDRPRTRKPPTRT